MEVASSELGMCFFQILTEKCSNLCGTWNDVISIEIVIERKCMEKSYPVPFVLDGASFQEGLELQWINPDDNSVTNYEIAV